MPPNSNNSYQTKQNESLLATSVPVRSTKSPAWTVADLFSEPPALGMFYHFCGTSYDLCTPLGTLIGSAVAKPLFSGTPFWTVAANGGLIGGGIGLVFGAATFTALSQGWMPIKEGTPPWNAQGILYRRDKVANNAMIRWLDAGTYTGIFMGALVMGAAGGPAALSLRTGLLGVCQGLTLGATVGSISTFGYLALRESKDQSQSAHL